jgi:cAMP-dependent protein kinase regulator
MTGLEYFKSAADLGPGAHFGELSLIYNSPRTASVISNGKCDLIVISRQSYNLVVRNYHTDHLNSMLIYYSNFSILGDASKELIFTLVTRTRYRRLKTNEVVLR